MNASQKFVLLLALAGIPVLWTVWVQTGEGLPIQKRRFTKPSVTVEREIDDPLFGNRTESVRVNRFVLGLDLALGGSALLGGIFLGGLVIHALRSGGSMRKAEG